ncbi:MAG: hypothetical protein AB1529_07950, partial [Candidatus Micrarchaeota archaeon]
TVVKTIEVKAFPQGAPGEPEKPGAAGPDAFSLLWLGVLLLLIVGVIVYWRSRQKKGGGKAQGVKQTMQMQV